MMKPMSAKSTHWLVIVALTLLIAGIDASARQHSNPHLLKPKEPSIYMQFESFDGNLRRVRFQFRNNTKFLIFLQQKGTYVDRENEVNFGVEPTRFTTCNCGSNGNCWGDYDEEDGSLPPPPKVEESDFGQYYVVAPGNSESFSIPERYFVNNANLYVVFTYDWERTPNEPKHRAYFPYCALPASVRKQIKDDASYMDELISCKDVDFVYSENEASPLSKNGNSISAVRGIVQLRDKAIPLLIAHLDDTRPTTAMVATGQRSIPAPVGFLALDILTAIVQAEESILNDCTRNVSGTCFERKYHLRADEVGTDDGERVKDAWREANRRGLLRFRFPDWWTDAQ
jgi:hypothetical protein